METLDFASKEPMIWWTSYSRVGIAMDTRNFPGDETWKRDRIPSETAIASDRIEFAAPEEWPHPGEPMVFEPTGHGLMRSDSANGRYEGVRAETPDAVVLTGNWEMDEYRGVFVAILPKARTA